MRYGMDPALAGDGEFEKTCSKNLSSSTSSPMQVGFQGSLVILSSPKATIRHCPKGIDHRIDRQV
jgi:hypothetical protein